MNDHLTLDELTSLPMIDAVERIIRLPAGREVDSILAEMRGMPFQPPRHGTCCTCRHCGYYYDDCGGRCQPSTDLEVAMDAFLKLPGYRAIELDPPTHGVRIGPFSFTGESLALLLCHALIAWHCYLLSVQHANEVPNGA